MGWEKANFSSVISLLWYQASFLKFVALGVSHQMCDGRPFPGVERTSRMLWAGDDFSS